jgi:adenylate cyclase, class 2
LKSLLFLKLSLFTLLPPVQFLFIERPMQLEVEQKHRVEDLAALEAQLEALGVKLGPPLEQADLYFAHPSRDFATTDEALRIRTAGGTSFVTYKGPKLDSATKTRRELELPLGTSDADGARFAELLRALGFRPVATVRKRRRTFHIEHDGQMVEGALDDVDAVGTFAELELQVAGDDFAHAKRTILSLAKELELGPAERRSYLEMLLEKEA